MQPLSLGLTAKISGKFEHGYLVTAFLTAPGGLKWRVSFDLHFDNQMHCEPSWHAWATRNGVQHPIHELFESLGDGDEEVGAIALEQELDPFIVDFRDDFLEELLQAGDDDLYEIRRHDMRQYSTWARF